MEGTTTTKSQQHEEQSEEEVDCSNEFSHLTISAEETRPSEAEVDVTNQAVTTAAPTDITTTTQQPRAMKLIVRSQYWGRTLKGKTCRTQASMNRPFRTISSQAVLYNTDEYWGCCPHHGKRVLELQECHFQDAMPDQDWDLYAVQCWSSPTHSINDFFLLPQNQSVIDVSRNIILSGWTFVGTCTANNIRDDLDNYLRPWLEENDTYGYRYHHVHIEIMMHSAFDRETPRSRKLNNEKARQERQGNNKGGGAAGQQQPQESSESAASEDAHSSEREGPPSVPGNPFVLRTPNHQGASRPPIPHVISNDSSSVFSHSMASSVMTTPYHDVHGAGAYHQQDSFWSPPTPGGAPRGMHHPHHHGHGPPHHHTAADPHMGMQWHPGGVHPSAVTHHQQQPYGGWHNAAPPPPPMTQMPSPALSHNSELQQYLMYSDPSSMPPPPPPPSHQYSYSNMPPNTPSSHHSYGSGLEASAILQGFVPSEILSHTSAAPFSNHTEAEHAVHSTPAPPSSVKPPTSGATADTAVSVSTTATTPVEESLVIGDDTVVTTVVSSNMVSSTCWSPTGKANNSDKSSSPAGAAAAPSLD